MLTPEELEKLSGARKAAILCLSLGEESAAEVFKYLDENEVQIVSRELALLRDVPRVTVHICAHLFRATLPLHAALRLGCRRFSRAR